MEREREMIAIIIIIIIIIYQITKIRGRLSLTHFEVFLPSHDTGVCVRVCVRVRA